MKKLIIRITLLLFPFSTFAVSGFDEYFTTGALRFDYLMTGDSDTAVVFPSEIKKEKIWGGSQTKLVDEQDLGTFRFKVFDIKSETLIFLQGFSPLFQEWQSTSEAKTSSRSFYQVLRFPFPKQVVRVEIDQRNHDGKFENIYSRTIEPTDYFIINESPAPVKTTNILYSGEPSRKIDIVILAEGYTFGEMGKFLKDCRTLTDSLFKTTPFSKKKDHFNIYALETPSSESGTDVPGEGIYRNTIFNSTFYTFDISRYLTTSDMKTIHDKAAVVPYDQIVILVNSPLYGGGGFYNYLNVCTSNNKLSARTFIHELGHSFAGLADEYYTSEVAFENYYNLNVEPWEPNITTLVDFASKWKDMVAADTPVPTPRFNNYSSKVGAFEGGGYMTKGIYSPMENCRMKSNETSFFCPVCQKAIIEAINYGTK